LNPKGTPRPHPDTERFCELLRRSEKFLFEQQTVAGIYTAIRNWPQEAISEFLPWFRTPYQLCWFENDWADGEPDDVLPDQIKPFRDGMLIQTDDTNLRDLFWYLSSQSIRSSTQSNSRSPLTSRRIGLTRTAD
jgi:hypothetical protein